ncbi:DEKNAAC100212 [Brettanomyces naardenensis]|uniref:DEKNAAC100212 n=1 Tax=Brettanomyces naardenensis TaxID=13370 RepID=A0A448YGC1_BRENA|nr:DEKNAAC100212 [Brettanomyces naardenensis]
MTTSSSQGLPAFSQEPRDLIYYLPIDQTLVQKELVELMVKLHRPNILKILGKLKTRQISQPDPAGNPFLDDGVMLETFVSNVKQIGNHPTLLVNHYIPKNMLLLDTKENIIDTSLKYVKLDEILNRLTEKKKPKTIIISVANGKELDLVESILIGKNGLQYYRFSGASIYYENHGSFDFSKSAPLSDEEEESQSEKQSSRSKSSTPSSLSSTKGRKRKGRGSYEKGSKSGRGGHHGNSRGNAHGPGGGGSGANHSGNDDTKQKRGDDYIPRISKNSPLYQKIQAEKHNMKLSVYLILSNQLKYLTQFEELKGDLIITMDSNLKQVSPRELQVPILKLVITNSLEYFDQQLKREVPTLKASPEIYNKFLTFLTVAYRSTVTTRNNNIPVSEDLIDWMMDVQHKEFPRDVRIPRFPVASLKIEDLAHQCEQSMEDIRFEKPYNLEKYEFYDPSLGVGLKDENTHKRQKLEELEVPALMSYRQYQGFLAEMVYERCKELEHAIERKKENLAVIHQDDSKRQYTLETNDATIGKMYEKLRTDTTNNESMGKQLDRLAGDISKLTDIRDDLQKRADEYKVKSGAGVKEDDVIQNEQMLTALRKQLSELQIQVEKDNQNDDSFRRDYQNKSSEAAQLSTELGILDKRIESLKRESNGLFKLLEEKRVEDEIEDLESRVKNMDKDNSFLESYIDHLDSALKERQKAAPQSVRKSSRSGTPY